jgi:hypothetical protein
VIMIFLVSKANTCYVRQAHHLSRRVIGIPCLVSNTPTACLTVNSLSLGTGREVSVR